MFINEVFLLLCLFVCFVTVLLSNGMLLLYSGMVLGIHSDRTIEKTLSV